MSGYEGFYISADISHMTPAKQAMVMRSVERDVRRHKGLDRRTGALSKGTFVYLKQGILTAGSTAPYAAAVHEGSKAHEIKAKKAKYLRFKGKDGKAVYRKRVWHPGFHGEKWILRAMKRYCGPTRIIDP